MRSCLTIAFALTFVCSPAIAGIGPQIAYQEQHQNGDEIYLINPDGSGHALVFKGPQKFFTNALDMRPGGGELAVSFRTRLFIVDYDDRGVLTSSREVPLPNAGCSVGGLDYHPTDQSLAVTQICGNTDYKVFRLAPGANSVDPTPLVSSTSPVGAHWSRHGSTLYYLAGAGAIYKLDFLANPTPTAQLVQPAGWGGIGDLLQTGEQSVWATTTAGSYATGDLVTGVKHDGCVQAQTIHYGPNDTQMVYRTPLSGGGYYVLVKNADCSGSPTALTGKGAFYYVDWRAP